MVDTPALSEVVHHLEGQESLSFLLKPQFIDEMPLFSDSPQKDFCHAVQPNFIHIESLLDYCEGTNEQKKEK
jgi:hypothetical protein